jgi:hypothetical protein
VFGVDLRSALFDSQNFYSATHAEATVEEKAAKLFLLGEEQALRAGSRLLAAYHLSRTCGHLGWMLAFS